MVRTTRGNVAAKRRKKYLHLAKGYVGSNSRLSTMATEQVVQSLNFAYIGRRLKKEIFEEFGSIELMLLLVPVKIFIQPLLVHYVNKIFC